MKHRFPDLVPATRWVALVLAASTLWLPTHAWGGWNQLSTTAPGAVSLMLLLPDGTVMAANNDDNTFGNAWYRLTPDSAGHYVNGAWTTRTPANYTRLFNSSVVLQDGRVFVAGGEYGTGKATAEIYDPVADAWKILSVPTSVIDPSNGEGFVDAMAKILPNGNVLIGPVKPHTSGGTVIYNPNSDTWSNGPTLVRGGRQAEASWVKLPDDSILTVDPNTQSSERYIPSLNQWVNDGNVPVALYDTLPGYFGELGPAFLLPNGKAFFVGASGNTAIYTPSGSSTPGSWAPGASIPGGLVAADAPGAMMVNGKVLCAVAPAAYVSGTNVIFPSPTTFYEYDPNANSFASVDAPGGGSSDNIPSYLATMLDLPDGTVLYAHMNNQLFVYQPSGAALPAGKPTITSISLNADGSFHLIGTLLNGISEGAAYGDDAQMDSNYPLVRMTDSGGNVTYARTHNWSSTSVMTGSTPQSTDFTVSPVLLPGNYSLVVTANGNASTPVSFSGPAWVNFSYASFLQWGTFVFPFHTMAQAIAGVPSGGTVLIETAASTPETMKISKSMKISAVGGPATIGR